MINLTDTLIPFQGLSEIHLYQNIDETQRLLETASLNFTTEKIDNNECTNPLSWIVLHIGESIHLFYANDKLFKIDVAAPYVGSLPNGIRIGMPITEATNIDSKLEYDEWNEDFESPDGYWVEDDLVTGLISSMTIFIKEIDNDDFEECNW